jgi:GNAT superfamily N-acetyltransferase
LVVGVTSIHRLEDFEAAGCAKTTLIAQIVQIFRDSAVRWPNDAVAARVFQTLWLDQYIEHEPELVYVALREGSVVGYLVGCRINPAISPRFSALAYFQDFFAECGQFPAHLHINVTRSHRGSRIGERLIEAICAQFALESVPGVHVVTGSDQRNVGFYTRLGFLPQAVSHRGKAEVVFLGRRLK